MTRIEKRKPRYSLEWQNIQWEEALCLVPLNSSQHLPCQVLRQWQYGRNIVSQCIASVSVCCSEDKTFKDYSTSLHITQFYSQNQTKWPGWQRLPHVATPWRIFTRRSGECLAREQGREQGRELVTLGANIRTLLSAVCSHFHFLMCHRHYFFSEQFF